nr:MAG TPA: hypothetical protein [Caudoviricetes sp.]
MWSELMLIQKRRPERPQKINSDPVLKFTILNFGRINMWNRRTE